MKRRVRRKRFILMLVVIVLGALFIRSDWLGKRIYPISYQDEIKRNAQHYELDPLLIAAIIRVESNYRLTAVSRKGAVGIMQIMPDTAEWILKQGDFGDITVKDAGSQAHAGIALGSWYVKELNRQFKGDLIKSLAAYNAGPGKVRSWLEKGVWDGEERTISDIPYGETRHYVQRVLYYYKKYQDIYETL
ncbi:lytic transglycosylase [Cohnella sp. CIP 111063]|jgi:Soluble lytic murein transglycosylase and related regulatory proteins (some contain LysM/invasin domains)|uniref:lytic transglycosylase domain-containing protein n=1 Tax=unclassified Cohnella TaxID=2636738 RepID=UPI000B8C5866|nr:MULTISPECIES: lytic transglycosylase domain-containing protein [unclassified Cohnella]OXS62748.1 lytic transglycosylase [Cohnella sp. CIP 111063]PRX75023.1 soluble lytic murein transglycosylase [Cohnella sp. SGD-V74]